jgi:hypothetical protein
MPAVVVDSSVLITLAAGEQFHLLRDFYSTIHIPPEVWNETTATSKAFGVHEVRQARADGWLVIQAPQDVAKVSTLPFNLSPEKLKPWHLRWNCPARCFWWTMRKDGKQRQRWASLTPAPLACSCAPKAKAKSPRCGQCSNCLRRGLPFG